MLKEMNSLGKKCFYQGASAMLKDFFVDVSRQRFLGVVAILIC
jgi:hypothetical protein